MRLSVVVVNWNSSDDLRVCLRSLAEQTYRDLEVVVVDNGSTDGSVEMVRAEFPSTTLVCNDENLGFAEACNIGIDASHGAWVCTLNNDTLAAPTWATALVDAAQAAPSECGMLQSLMLYTSRPDVINSTGVELSQTGGGRDRLEGEPRSVGESAAEIFCPSAGAAAYRRTMLDEIRTAHGYFDRRHFMYYEDMDLGWRARLAGWTARYVPEAVVHHVWHGSSHRHGETWLRNIARTNRLRVLLNNASWQLLLRSAPVTLRIVAELVWQRGPKALSEVKTVATDSLASRRVVEQRLRRERRAIEKRWAIP